MGNDAPSSKDKPVQQLTIGSLSKKLLHWQTIYNQKVTNNPKVKFFTRAMWLLSLTWAIYISWQSIPFYTHMARGKAFFQAGQYAPAEGEYNLALLQAESFHQQDPRLVGVLNNLAELYKTEGHYKKAEQSYDRLLQIMKHAWWHKDEGLEIIHNNRASLFFAEGRYADAVNEYNLALTFSKRSPDPYRLSILTGLANALREQGKFGQAEDDCRQALKACESGGVYDPKVAMVFDSLGRVFLDTGRYKEAATAFTQATSVDIKTLGAKHPYVAKDLNNLGELYLAEGDYKRSRECFQQALVIRKAAFGDNHPQTARTVNDLGQLEMQSGNLDAASKLLQSALKTREAVLGFDHSDVATTLNLLAQLSLKQGHAQQARQLIDRAIAIEAKTRGNNSPATLRSLAIKAQIDKQPK